MSQTLDVSRRILVIGNSDSAATLALARTAGPAGMLICLEGDREAAARAVHAFAREGLHGRVSVVTGDPALFIRKVAGPFDLIVLTHTDPAALARVESHVPRLLAPSGTVQR